MLLLLDALALLTMHAAPMYASDDVSVRRRHCLAAGKSGHAPSIDDSVEVRDASRQVTMTETTPRNIRRVGAAARLCVVAGLGAEFGSLLVEHARGVTRSVVASAHTLVETAGGHVNVVVVRRVFVALVALYR